MRVFAFFLAASLAAGTGHAAGPRIASLKLCTDELLLALAEPGQIASVTHLAQNRHEYARWRDARRYRKNDGSLLSAAAQGPDIVLDMGGGSRDVTRIGQRLGIRVLTLPYPQSLSDIETSIATVADAIGRPEAGRRLLGQIRALRQSRPQRLHDTIWLGGGGRSMGAQGLGAEWMALAGFRQRALPAERASLEYLLVSPPPILLRSSYRSGQYSGEQRWLRHPLAKGTRRSRSILTDGRPWTCMGPAMIGEVLRLRKAGAR